MNQLKPASIRQYLLGTLEEPERAEFEKRLLTDETLYDELLMQENELTDEYIADELSDQERQSYQNFFLSAPERHAKHRFALSLQRYTRLANQPQHNQQSSSAGEARALPRRVSRLPFFQRLQQQNPIVAYALAAGVVFAFVGIAWMVAANLKPSPAGTGSTVLVTLTPGLTRGTGETKVVQITPDIGFLQLRLQLLSDEYQLYGAELLSSANDSIFVATGLTPHVSNGSRYVEFTVPADLVKRDDYHVRLSGRVSGGTYESVAGYYLRILK